MAGGAGDDDRHAGLPIGLGSDGLRCGNGATATRTAPAEEVTATQVRTDSEPPKGNATLAEKIDHRKEIKMTHVAEMLGSYPKSLAWLDQAKLAECIEACFDCAQVCTACADACLAEEMVADLVHCIRTDLDCAAICATTGTILSRQTGSDASVTEVLLEACRIACRVCGNDCASHADMHEHCRICAETCRRCEAACAALLSDLG
jgi:hypothetical protein